MAYRISKLADRINALAYDKNSQLAVGKARRVSYWIRWSRWHQTNFYSSTHGA